MSSESSYIAVNVNMIVIDIASRSATDSGGMNKASQATGKKPRSFTTLKHSIVWSNLTNQIHHTRSISLNKVVVQLPTQLYIYDESRIGDFIIACFIDV